MQVRLVDVPELRYFSTDKPHPRGECTVRTPNMFNTYFRDEERATLGSPPDAGTGSSAARRWSGRARCQGACSLLSAIAAPSAGRRQSVARASRNCRQTTRQKQRARFCVCLPLLVSKFKASYARPGSREAFTPEGFFRMGDIVESYMDAEGRACLRVVGRAKNTLKLSVGECVESGRGH